MWRLCRRRGREGERERAKSKGVKGAVLREKKREEEGRRLRHVYWTKGRYGDCVKKKKMSGGSVASIREECVAIIHYDDGG